MFNGITTLLSINLFFLMQVIISATRYNGYVTDIGKNLSIPCLADGNIIWIKGISMAGHNSDDSDDNDDNDLDYEENKNKIIQTGKYLVLTNVTAADSGLYTCFAAVSPFLSNQTYESSFANDPTVFMNRNDSGILVNSSEDQQIYNIYEAVSEKDFHNDLNSQTTKNATTTSIRIMPQANASATRASNRLHYSQHIISNATGNNYGKDSSAFTTIIPLIIEEEEFQAFHRINLTVRTPPGPVSQLYFKASTILGFLIWRFNPSTNSGGYPIRSFTAEYRNISYKSPPYNASFEHEWSRMDPINIAPNVRQMEVYHLEPNTTYEFRIWANNHLGSGDIVTTNVTTLAETKEEDLIRLIQPDLDNFDPRIWMVAVGIVLGTFVILAVGLCIVLSRECYQSMKTGESQPSWNSIEMAPNIILNPGFCENDDQSEGGVGDLPRTHSMVFGKISSRLVDADNADSDADDGSDSQTDSDHEPPIQKFKRKVSVFFTDPTIKRI